MRARVGGLLAGSAQTPLTAGVYGAKGITAASNMPGARDGAVAFTDATGHFWLFGGAGYDSAGMSGSLNDLWSYNLGTKQWTWIRSANTGSAAGVYGTLGVSTAANTPGARASAIGWVDGANDLWLFGGEAPWGTSTPLDFSMILS